MSAGEWWRRRWWRISATEGISKCFR